MVSIAMDSIIWILCPVRVKIKNARGLNVKPILYKNPFWVVELYENPKMIFGEFKNQCNKFLKLL